MIVRRKKRDQDVLRPRRVRREMVFRIRFVELCDRCHRIPGEAVFLSEEFAQISIFAAGAIPSREQEDDLPSFSFQNDLQNIPLTAMPVKGRADRDFVTVARAGVLPLLAARYFAEQQFLRCGTQAPGSAVPFVPIYMREHLQRIDIDTREYASYHFRVAFRADRNNAAGPDQRQQDVHLIAGLVPDDLRVLPARRKEDLEYRHPFYPKTGPVRPAHK